MTTSRIAAVLVVALSAWTASSAFQGPSGSATLPPNQWPPERTAGPTSPALSPAEALKTFSVPPGYHVELVAAEPLVDSPILIDFDPDGRMWVVETPAFLPDLSGRDSSDPINRVVVLEDLDDDGRMDKRTVFADGLVMPRALKVLDHGVLVGEPPNLWLMKDTDGDLKSDSKDLVTDGFGRANAGIEHNANGLFWAMDNVMYTSEHTWNLRFKRGGATARDLFQVIPTLSRGQWQISQDDAGRIFRNVNDSPLYVDYTPAQYFLRNPNVVRTRGAYEILLEQMDATVYPVRPTRGVNRGYRDEYFRADGSSIVIQGAGTPTIYRGDRYPPDVRGHAFITDSPTNLVHEMTVVDDGTGRLSARNTHARGEFFASSDERSRPVNLFSAPDGTMYIVDMYRGVVQAGGLWSDYLSDYIKSREMLLPVARGRIWRVVYGTGPGRRGSKPSLASASPQQLVDTLSHPNGWWRDTAQRLLIERGHTSMAPALEALAASAPDWRTKLHALWTLDGLDAIRQETIERALADSSSDVRAAAVRISERWLGADTPWTAKVLALSSDPGWNVRRQVAVSLGAMPASSRVAPALAILARDGNDPIVVDGLVSSLNGIEAEVLDRVMQTQAAAMDEGAAMLAAAVAKSAQADAVLRLAEAAVDESRPASLRTSLLRGLSDGLPAAGGRGGRGGGGLPGLSPPGGRVAITPGRGVALPSEPTALVQAAAGTTANAELARTLVAKLNWPGKPAPPAPAAPPLSADDQKRFDAGKEVFANLCAGCHDVTGQGKDRLGPSLLTSKYTEANPQVLIRILTGGKEGPTGLMPPVTGTLTDAQIAAVLTYIRREWGHTASPVGEIDVRELRQSTSWRKQPWTEAELSGMVAGGRGRGRGN